MARQKRTRSEIARGRALGRVLQKARGRRKSAKVAGAAGVSIDTLRKLEQGRVADPGFFLVGAIAQALGLPLDTIAARTRRQDR